MGFVFVDFVQFFREATTIAREVQELFASDECRHSLPFIFGEVLMLFHSISAHEY